MTAITWFFIGLCCGIIIKDLLPPDVINQIKNDIKVKKGSINNSDLNVTPDNIQPKKKGIFKRIFGRKNR